MSQRIRKPKLKSAKTSGTIQGLLHSLQCARLLLDRADHTLCDVEDTESIRERMTVTLKDLGFLTRRLKIEYRFLKWKEDKIARGEWRGELEIPPFNDQPECAAANYEEVECGWCRGKGYTNEGSVYGNVPCDECNEGKVWRKVK